MECKSMSCRTVGQGSVWMAAIQGIYMSLSISMHSHPKNLGIIMSSADTSQPKHVSVPRAEMWAKMLCYPSAQQRLKRWKSLQGLLLQILGVPANASGRQFWGAAQRKSRHITKRSEALTLRWKRWQRSSLQLGLTRLTMVHWIGLRETSTGIPWNSHIQWENRCFPVDFPFNQSCECLTAWSFSWRPARLWSKSCTAPGSKMPGGHGSSSPYCMYIHMYIYIERDR